MAIVLRPACGVCGSFDTASRGGWIRCKSCKTLVGQDAISFADTDEYAAFVKRAMQPDYAAKWSEHQTLLDEANALVDKREWNAAYDVYRYAARWLVESMPQSYPPEVAENPKYREYHVAWTAFTLFAQHASEKIAALVALQLDLVVKDFQHPLPAIQAMCGNITTIIEHMIGFERGTVGCPADPDDLTTAARARIACSQYIAGSINGLEEPVRAKVLAWFWGAGQVSVVKPQTNAATAQAQEEGSLFLEAACPRCKSWFLATRGASDLTCPACMRRYPMNEGWFKKQPLLTDCTRCGAPVALPGAVMRAKCNFCGGEAVRVAADDARRVAAHQQLLHSAYAFVGLAAGAVEQVPEEGVGGYEVTADNRARLVVEGLSRTASWYARFISPARYLRLVLASFEGESSQAVSQVFDAIETDLRTQPSTLPSVAALVIAARDLLLRSGT